MKQDAKLRANWSRREKDVMLHYPMGRHTKSDAHYLSTFFNGDFIQQMKDRGYDITTLKFEISPLLPSERFEALSKEYGK